MKTGIERIREIMHNHCEITGSERIHIEFIRPLENQIKELKSKAAETLDWMIKHFDFMNSQTGLHTEDSPELKEAKELLAELAK